MRDDAQRTGSTILGRRAFLVSSGVLTAGVTIGGGYIWATWAPDNRDGLKPNIWVSITPDGIVTIQQPAAEIGQGASTVLPMILAEEMDADWDKVRIEDAPYRRDYANPGFTNGGVARFVTADSSTTPGYWAPLRQAGAQARRILMQTAADRWGVPLSEVTTQPGRVLHRESTRSMGYGEASTHARVPGALPEIPDTELKPRAAWRLVGTDVARVDMADKITGRARFGIDFRIDGMLTAAIARAPVEGGTPVAVDMGETMKIPGVREVRELPQGVAVVADSAEAALRGRKALQVDWNTDVPAAAYDSETAKTDYLALAKDSGRPASVVHEQGDMAAAAAVTVLTGDYVSDHVTQACMEPMNATARVHSLGKGADLWVPTQSQDIDMLWTARSIGTPPFMIDARRTLAGGGVGRRVDNGVVGEAAMLSRDVGAPVKVLWRFEDDIRRGLYRALAAQHLRATLDGAGRITSWSHRIVADSVYARMFPERFAEAGDVDRTVVDGQRHIYDIPAQRLDYIRQDRGIPIGYLRGVGGGYTVWAIETFLDRIAAHTAADPVTLRLDLLPDARARRVIEAAAEMAGWGRNPGRGLGIAYSLYRGTHTAVVAEVEAASDGTITNLRKFWAATDPGLAIHPGNVVAQLEGGLTMGASLALSEAVPFIGGEAQVANLYNYPVLRMSDAPEIDVRIVDSGADAPTGVGESGVPPAAAAIANAVFAATGVVYASQPFQRRV